MTLANGPEDLEFEAYPREERSRTPLTVARAAILTAAALGILGIVFAGAPSSAEREAPGDDPDFPQLFRVVGQVLEENYLDPSRIRPRELIERAFAALETSVDEIYVDYSEDTKPFLAVHIESKVQVFNLDSVDSLDAAIRMLENVFVFVKNNYRGDREINEMRYAAINGFLSGLDPHTMVFSPDAFKDFSVTIKGEIFGVGMLVGSRDGKLVVIEVLKGTPANKAGFLKGDLIVKIGDESTINMTVPEAVEKIRGALKSWVTLTIKRAKPDTSELEALEIPVQRDRVEIISTQSKLLPPDPDAGRPAGVGYVKVISFDQNTTDRLRQHLKSMVEANGGKPLSALILDLRGNSGGLLTQAVEMSDLFLESGAIVIQATRGARGHQFYEQDAEDQRNEPTYPIVVLANETSASGAEIVTGALQKNRRAVVIGSNTFGKGSVQQLHRLPNGAQLKITVSEYLLPGKISIQENGVVPDVHADPVFIKDGTFNLFPDERSMTEKDYDRHIVSTYARKEVPTYTIDYLEDFEPDDPYSDTFMSGDIVPEKDKLVQMAVRMLRIGSSAPAGADPQADVAPDLLAAIVAKEADVQAYEAELFDGIVRKLAEEGVDWSVPAADSSGGGSKGIDPKTLDVAISHRFVDEPSPDKEDPVPIRNVVLSVKLTNRGDGPIYRMKGLSKSEYFPFKDQEFLFGKVEPGQTVERSVKVRLPHFPYSRNDLFTVEVSSMSAKPQWEAAEDVILSKSAAVVQDADGRPSFAYSAELIDVTDPADPKPIRSLETRTEAVLKVKIRNVGTAPVFKGVAVLRNETGRQVFLHEPGRIAFPEPPPPQQTATIGFRPEEKPAPKTRSEAAASGLAPGEVAEVKFSFEVRPGDPVDFYAFEIAVIDSYSNASLSHRLSIPPREKEDVKPFPNGVEFTPPRVAASIGPKSGAPLLVTDEESLSLETLVESSDHGGFKAWVFDSSQTGLQDIPDKVGFQDSRGEPRMEITIPVSLKKGQNSFTVIAEDRNGLENRDTVFIRRE